MRLITLSEVLDSMSDHPGAIGWLVFAAGCVFGIGLARIVLALAGI